MAAGYLGTVAGRWAQPPQLGGLAPLDAVRESLTCVQGRRGETTVQAVELNEPSAVAEQSAATGWLTGLAPVTFVVSERD